MENPVWYAGFLAFIGLICVFKFPEGIYPNISKSTDEFWVLIAADLTALCISRAVMILQKTVEPKTWTKVEKHAGNAMFLAMIFELIAIREFVVTAYSDTVWERAILNWECIGFIGVFCVVFIWGVVKACTTHQEEIDDGLGV